MPDLLLAWAGLWRRFGVGGTPAPLPDDRPAFAADYDAVYQRLDPVDLGGTAEDGDDIALDLFRVDRRGRRLLSTYDEAGAAFAFEQYGFFHLLRERGFDPVLHLDASDPDACRLYVHDGEPLAERRVVELVLGERDLTLPDGTDTTFLFVHWLMMRDPRAVFGPDDRPLPGQTHPGLGLFIRFAYLLKLMVDRVGCDGLSNHPAQPHNGVLYGKFCHFVDPVLEGRFRALLRDVDISDLAQLTAWVEAGAVVDADGHPYVWEPGPQVHPVSPSARAWFEGAAYRDEVARVLAATQWQVVDEAATAAVATT